MKMCKAGKVRITSPGVCAVVFVLALSASATGTIPPRLAPRAIRVSSLSLIRPDGRLSALLSLTTETLPGLEFYSRENQVRMGLGFDTNRDPIVYFLDGPKRAGLKLTASQEASALQMYERERRSHSELGALTGGVSTLALVKGEGRTRMLCTVDEHERHILQFRKQGPTSWPALYLNDNGNCAFLIFGDEDAAKASLEQVSGQDPGLLLRLRNQDFHYP